MQTKQVALISTGGTIEKTYDELSGVLTNFGLPSPGLAELHRSAGASGRGESGMQASVSVLDVMLATLELEGIALTRVLLMNKDSLDMTPADHTVIAETAGKQAKAHDGVVIVHGTDRLATTGERIVELLGTPRVPVVLTGAMRPYALRTTDALQNLTESLLAVQILAPGVYVAMHSKVLRFPGVVKDRAKGTFVRK